MTGVKLGRDWSTVEPRFEQLQQPGFPFNRTVQLRHPGYADGNCNLLFRFPAYDHAGGGLHHNVARTACGIVAGNKWDGYLSSTASGPPVEQHLDQVLTGPCYYFHPHHYHANRDEPSAPLPSLSPSPCCSVNPYAIYPTFQDWRFPHENQPPWWPQIPHNLTLIGAHNISTITAQTRTGDRTCRLTDSTEELEVPHIIPVKEEEWFDENDMGQYSSGHYSVTNSANLFLLRKDLHASYEHLKWAIVPKLSKWCFIYLDRSRELGALYHNHEMHPITGVASQYLLAGFARVVFFLLGQFLTNRADKRLVGKSVGVQDPAGRELTGLECAQKFRMPGERSGSRSPEKGDNTNSPKKNGSPSKRKRSVEDVVGMPLSSASCLSLSPKPAKLKRDDATLIPCTCALDQLPSPEPSGSPCTRLPDTALADIACLSRSCCIKAESNRHRRLREQALEAERARSDVGDWWEQTRAWTRDCSLMKISGYDISQFFWASGQEILDDKGEHLDTSEEFFQQVGWMQFLKSSRLD
ncbi:MAG: hypothetical protein Q9222_002411 [Ikaeria aurantiellina]